MNKIEYSGIAIVQLFLEKLELLNPRERAAIVTTIEFLNHPIFSVDNAL